jgi:hypothetical protein
VGHLTLFSTPFQELPNGRCPPCTRRPKHEYVVAGAINVNTELDGSHAAWLADDFSHMREFFGRSELKMVDRT